MEEIEQKRRVVEIITETFQDNPSVLGVIRNDRKKLQRLAALAAYAYETARRRSGVFLSRDGQGVGLCYVENKYPPGLRDYLEQTKLALRAIGLSRVSAIMKKDAYVKKQRPQKAPYLYFWFLGVSKSQPSQAAWELKEKIFNYSSQEKLPIYLETSVVRNKQIYERYGFRVYHEWKLPDQVNTLWFMRRDPICRVN